LGLPFYVIFNPDLSGLTPDLLCLYVILNEVNTDIPGLYFTLTYASPVKGEGNYYADLRNQVLGGFQLSILVFE